MKQRSNILKDFYTKLAPSYDEVTLSDEAKWIAPRVVNEYLEEILEPSMSIIDIGVGTGQSIKMPYNLGCKVTGLDLSPEMIKFAQTSYPKGKFLVADLEKEWPLNQKYDVVIASGVLEFVENIELVFSKTYTHLKRSGYFIFTYEKFISDHDLQQFREAKLGEGLFNEVPEEFSFRVYRRTEAELAQSLEAKNFKILKKHEFISYYKKDGEYPVTYGIILAQKT